MKKKLMWHITIVYLQEPKNTVFDLTILFLFLRWIWRPWYVKETRGPLPTYRQDKKNWLWYINV